MPRVTSMRAHRAAVPLTVEADPGEFWKRVGIGVLTAALSAAVIGIGAAIFEKGKGGREH